MKVLGKVFFMLFCLVILGCSQEREESSLIDKEGLKYAQGEDKPYGFLCATLCE